MELPIFLHSEILRYVRWEDRQARLLGKLLLLYGLKTLGYNSPLLTNLRYNTYGKPYLKNGPYFNISHSRKYVICAISQNSLVGVDIEAINPINLVDYKSVLNRAEWEIIMTSSNPVHTFFDIWTKKEAVTKAIGKGLNIPFQDIFIFQERAVVNEQLWFLEKLPVDDNYSTALATNNLKKKVKLKRFDFV